MSAVRPEAGRFVGARVLRREDPRLLTGRGRYVDDVVLPGMLHAAFVRSPHARARIVAVEVSEACRLPDVVAVYAGVDLNPDAVDSRTYVPSSMGTFAAGFQAPHLPLAVTANHVGDPVALVIARDRYIAEDAAELVTVEYEPLPPVIGASNAAASQEHVHPEAGSNVAYATPPAQSAELDEIFRRADRVVSESLVQHRYVAAPMETRGIVARWEPASQRLEIWMSTRVPHEIRHAISRLLGVSEDRVRVVMGDVGGAFGSKARLGHEEMSVLLAARRLARPVKWIEDRYENLVCSTHSREASMDVSLAISRDGVIEAARIDHRFDLGAYPVSSPAASHTLLSMVWPGPYRIVAFEASGSGMFTNTGSLGSYRGPWMFETVTREVMVDIAAREIGLDPLEVRRRNVILREDQPYRSATGLLCDRISPAETLEQAVALIGYDEFRASQAAAVRARGHHRGIGLSMYLEPSAMGVGAFGVEVAQIRIDPSGAVNVASGVASHGQGLETTLAQIVADTLGIDIDSVSVHQGDTAVVPYGSGTAGSRSAVIGGGAMLEAAGEMRRRVLGIAAMMLEASVDDLQIIDGVVSVVGTPTRRLHLSEIAGAAYRDPTVLPSDHQAGLDVTMRWRAPFVTLSNATHACIVEVDDSTGRVEILRYVVSEDCGSMINPTIVEGQIIGGVAQGIGGVLYEHFRYDNAGNPLTTTLLDYLLPTACEIPQIEIGHVVTPSGNPGGFKGMGEGGAIASPAAVINAIADALAPLGIKITQQPLGPDQILDLLAGVSAMESGGRC